MQIFVYVCEALLYFLSNLLISLYQLAYKLKKHSVIKENITLDDLIEKAKFQFKLPEAKRYEGFSINTSEEKDTYKVDVIEPKVSFIDYAEELNETLGGNFTRAEIEAGAEQESWTFKEDGQEYIVYFQEFKDDGGNITKWEIQVEIKHQN